MVGVVKNTRSNISLYYLKITESIENTCFIASYYLSLTTNISAIALFIALIFIKN